ncbi:MAG: hypothetical protein ACM31C_04300 [Acidobacteriota bacterium]
MNAARERAIATAAWLTIAAAGVYQLVLLAIAIGGRVAYPYDLEWMEGGLLHHAQRLQEGHGIYAPPSVDFIPYLYTPLYPAVLAMVGKIFGLGYTLGRMVSVLSLVAIVPVAALSIAGRRFRHAAPGPAWAGVVLALGLFAATYPFVEGWYDLVRADTFFAFLVTAGLAAAATWSTEGIGWRGEARIAAVATILVHAIFTKPTGIFYVALGAAIVAARSPRRTATYVITATILGVGGCAIANVASDGWFWIYVQKIHRAHDFNLPRFYKSFGLILWHFPALTIVVVATLVVVGYTWLRPPRRGDRRELPRQARPFLLWTGAFAVSTIVGAVGWGTEFARYNAYTPAFLHGALAAGAALPALAACTGILWGSRPRTSLVSHAVAGTAGLALAVTLVHAHWQPRQFVPTARDRAAGAKLVARLAAIDGEIWVPHHPWYAVLANKAAHVHRMGITDVTRGQNRYIAGLDQALWTHRFAAILLDSKDLNELGRIQGYYRPALKLPDDERPHLYTGAGTFYDPWGCCQVPDTIWLPAIPAAPPSGAKVLFDLEYPTWNGWTRSGPAWGDGPVTTALPGQDLVVGATGLRFATSMHGGDAASGRMTSPPFAIDGERITLMLGGSTDVQHVRVELWVDEAIARIAGVPAPGGDTLRVVEWNVAELRGKQGKLVLVDDTPAGHLDVDDVWQWSH